jgi:hypothetical protein
VAQPQPAAPAKRRSRKGAIAILAAAIIVLLLIGAVLVSAAGRQTTLSLSSDSVVPGASLVVNATNVPANQTGEIQLWSVLHTFAFRSDANGKVAIDITVPRDIGAGDHLVKVCWAGTCHAQSTLHVIASVATATPTPSPSPTTSPSPAARSLALSSSHIRVKTGTLTVAGQHFTPRASVAVSFVQNQTAVVATTSAGPEGNFLATFTIPSWAVLGPAGIKACDSACANASVSVTSS